MKSLLIVCVASFLLLPPPASESYLIVGTYTGGQSEGIYVYRFNSDNGTYKEVSHVKTSNPSYVVVSPDEKFVYAVHEDAGNNGKGGEISAFAFDKRTGVLTYLNKQPTNGDHPCYVDVDRTGRWVVAANYSSGSLSLIPVQPDGSLGNEVNHITHEGSGTNRQRQEKPHVHCTLFSSDNKTIYVPDLGIDKVMMYSFNAATGDITPARQPFAKSEDGAGPRHITFHPNNKYAYLVEELSGTVVAYRHKKGTLKKIQRVSTMPVGDSTFPGSADIHVSPDGRFLYASNRSTSNTIAIFSIDKKGKLTPVAHQSTLGNGPRNFNFDPSGNFLLVGNQNSNEIVVFKRDGQSGRLTDSGTRISVGKPVCLKWISGN